MREYDIIFEKLQNMLSNGDITVEKAEELNKKAFEKYCGCGDCPSCNPEVPAGSKEDANVDKSMEVADKKKVVDGTTLESYSVFTDSLDEMVTEGTISIEDALDIMESYVDQTDIVVTEGENLEITKSVKELVKTYRVIQKELKTAIKNKKFDVAHKKVAEQKKILEKAKKELSNMKNEDDKLALLIGVVIGLTILSVKYTAISLAIISTAGYAGVAAANIGKAVDGTMAAVAAAASTAGLIQGAGSLGATVEALNDEVDLLVAHEKEVTTKKADLSALNVYKQIVVKDITRAIKHLDKVDKAITKKEKAFKEAEKKAKSVKESTDEDYINGLINTSESTELSNKKLAIYEAYEAGIFDKETKDDLLSYISESINVNDSSNMFTEGAIKIADIKNKLDKIRSDKPDDEKAANKFLDKYEKDIIKISKILENEPKNITKGEILWCIAVAIAMFASMGVMFAAADESNETKATVLYILGIITPVVTVLALSASTNSRKENDDAIYRGLNKLKKTLDNLKDKTKNKEIKSRLDNLIEHIDDAIESYDDYNKKNEDYKKRQHEINVAQAGSTKVNLSNINQNVN